MKDWNLQTGRLCQRSNVAWLTLGELCRLVEIGLVGTRAQEEEQLGGHCKDQARDETAWARTGKERVLKSHTCDIIGWQIKQHLLTDGVYGVRTDKS